MEGIPIVGKYQYGIDALKAKKARDRQATNAYLAHPSVKRKKKSKRPKTLLRDDGTPLYPKSNSPFQNVRVGNSSQPVDAWIAERTAVWKKKAQRPPVDPIETQLHPTKTTDLVNFVGDDGLWRFANGDLRKFVFLRDCGQCQYCGVILSYDDCFLDHVVPWPKGKTIPSNLCVVCPPCNKLKGRAAIPQRLRPLLPAGLSEQALEIARFKVNQATLARFKQTPNLRHKHKKG